MLLPPVTDVPGSSTVDGLGASTSKYLTNTDSIPARADSMEPSSADFSTKLDRVLNTADNLRIAKILVQMGLDSRSRYPCILSISWFAAWLSQVEN
jgi:hypothetical protein